MATVQISFTDASNNETSFKVFRSDNGGNAVNDDLKKVGDITYDGSDWQIAAANSFASVTLYSKPASGSGPDAQGQQFSVRYEEGDSGDYKYGVVASNDIGDSDITESSVVSV